MRSKTIYLVVGVKGYQAYSTTVIARGLRDQFIKHGWVVNEIGIEPNAKVWGRIRFLAEFFYRYLLLPLYCRKHIPLESIVYIVDHADSTIIRWLKESTVFLHFHDLTSLRPPWDYPYKNTLKSVLIFMLSYLFKRPGMVRANRIIAISNFTSKEIQNYLPVEAGRIAVVHNGVAMPDRGDIPAFRSQLGINDHDRIMISVGPATIRKNYRLIANAFEHLDSSWLWIHLGDLDGDTKQYLKEHSLLERVRIIRFIENIGDLYAVGSVLVHASHYEGFGLPVVEAMLTGLPTVSIDKEISREIYAEHTLYYTNAQELVGILNKEKFKNIDVSKARFHALKYSWDRAGKKINCLISEYVS